MEAKDPKPARIASAPEYFTIEIRDMRGVSHYSGVMKLRRAGTGSWMYNDAAKIALPGSDTERLQLTLNATIIGSKKWPAEEETE